MNHRLIESKALFTMNWQGPAGPVIEVTTISGQTSGRFDVARIIARYFPARMDFVHSVIAEGIEPASQFPSGPCPKDTLTHRNDRIVEYRTPPHTEGLGTVSQLQKS